MHIIQNQINDCLNLRAQLSSGAKSLNFHLSIDQLPYFVYVSSEGPGETALMPRLASLGCLVMRSIPKPHFCISNEVSGLFILLSYCVIYVVRIHLTIF